MSLKPYMLCVCEDIVTHFNKMEKIIYMNWLQFVCPLSKAYICVLSNKDTYRNWRRLFLNQVYTQEKRGNTLVWSTMNTIGKLPQHWTLMESYLSTEHYWNATSALNTIGKLPQHWTLLECYLSTEHYWKATSALNTIGKLPQHWTLLESYLSTEHYWKACNLSTLTKHQVIKERQIEV